MSREVRAFVRWLESVIHFKHNVDVIVCSKLYGYFDAPGERRGFTPYIVVPLDENLIPTLAHEAVHYEQWRDDREMNERGVEQRAQALVRRWRREGAA